MQNYVAASELYSQNSIDNIDVFPGKLTYPTLKPPTPVSESSIFEGTLGLYHVMVCKANFRSLSEWYSVFQGFFPMFLLSSSTPSTYVSSSLASMDANVGFQASRLPPSVETSIVSGDLQKSFIPSV